MILRIFRDSYNKKSFLRNFSVLTISNIIVNILGLFINVYLARTLKPALYGEYGVILTTAGIFYTLSSLGLQQIVIRSIARNQENSKYYFQISLIARITGILLAIVIFVIYINLIDKEYSLLLYLFMILYIITMSCWDAFQNVAFGMQRMEYTGYINVIASTILLIIYLVLPKSF
jgi:PST family polysaccharide transporter